MEKNFETWSESKWRYFSNAFQSRLPGICYYAQCTMIQLIIKNKINYIFRNNIIFISQNYCLNCNSSYSGHILDSLIFMNPFLAEFNFDRLKTVSNSFVEQSTTKHRSPIHQTDDRCITTPCQSRLMLPPHLHAREVVAVYWRHSRHFMGKRWMVLPGNCFVVVPRDYCD